MIKDERGQALTEFAIVVPLLLLMLCGTVDMGRLMFAFLNMNNAAQETARLGELGQNDSTMTTFATNYVRLGDPSKLIVAISPSDATRHSGDYVTVTLKYPFTYMTPVVSKLLPAPVVQAASTIRVE